MSLSLSSFTSLSLSLSLSLSKARATNKLAPLTSQPRNLHTHHHRRKKKKTTTTHYLWNLLNPQPQNHHHNQNNRCHCHHHPQLQPPTTKIKTTSQTQSKISTFRDFVLPYVKEKERERVCFSWEGEEGGTGYEKDYYFFFNHL